MTGSQDPRTGPGLRLVAYLAITVGGAFLFARLGVIDCRRTAGGDDGLCGLASLVWGPIAFLALAAACLVAELVVRRRRRG